MMGTLAGGLAGKRIPYSRRPLLADVEGDIEDVNGILKITGSGPIPFENPQREGCGSSGSLLDLSAQMSGGQSVIGCIRIEGKLIIEEEG